MITISIARTNYKPETIDIKSNIDIDDSQSKVKVPDNEDKPIHYVRFTNQKRPFIELDRSTTSAGKASFYVKIISDLDHTSSK